MVGVSASQSIDLGFIFQIESYQKTLKTGIHSFAAWRSAKRNGVDNKRASFLVVSLGKTHNGMSPCLCGKQVAGLSSLCVVVTQSN